MASIEEYRGINKWEGLLPAFDEPEWDEGFRAFLLKYGMLNHVVYDVFVRGDKDENGLRGTCRFKDCETFTNEGLKFRYLNKVGEEKMEYDFTEEYKIVGNIICSPRSFFTAEDNWFGFIALSADESEMVIVFRGTETTKEWVENATVFMEHLDGAERESCLPGWNRGELMVHKGFQQLYCQQCLSGEQSPKETVRRMVEEYKGSLTNITVLGHSLGGALAQLCGIDLVHFDVSGDIPVTVIAWGAPKVGNARMAEHAESLHPKLRVLRIRNPVDSVANLPPDWICIVTAGGYQHLGTELSISNDSLKEEGIIKADAGNSPNHNLEVHLQCVDRSRDVALMNKVAGVLTDDFAEMHCVSASWHNQNWPRSII